MQHGANVRGDVDSVVCRQAAENLNTPVCFSQWRTEATLERGRWETHEINREHFMKTVFERSQIVPTGYLHQKWELFRIASTKETWTKEEIYSWKYKLFFLPLNLFKVKPLWIWRFVLCVSCGLYCTEFVAYVRGERSYVCVCHLFLKWLNQGKTPYPSWLWYRSLSGDGKS